MFNTFVAVLLLGTVPLAGGRLSRLAGIRLAWAPVVVLALLLQVVMSEVADHAARPLLIAVHLSSYLLIAAALWRNRRVAGLPLIALGAASNMLAISMNHGVMPASARALAAAGMRTDAADFANSDVVAHPVLPWLGDVLATPSWLPLRNMLSVGDLLILLGGAVLLHVVCGSRLVPRRWRPDADIDAPPVGALSPPALSFRVDEAHTPQVRLSPGRNRLATVSGKNKGGREDRKPKQEQNKKHKGVVVPSTAPALDAVNHTPRRPKG